MASETGVFSMLQQRLGELASRRRPPQNPLSPAPEYQGEGERPDPYKQKRKISERIDKLLARSRYLRYNFEREWFQYVLYYASNQWVVWDRDRRQWRRKRGPNWWPTPVTNVFAEKLDDNISSLVQENPVLSWVPESDDAVDIATAEVADRVDEAIAEEVGRKRRARELATWTVTTGSGFVENGYDASPEHGMSFLEYEECRECGFVGSPKEFRNAEDGCPECGESNTMSARERTGAVCERCGTQFPDPELAFQPCPQCEEQNLIETAERSRAAEAMSAIAGGPVNFEPLEPAPPLKPVHSSQPVGEQVPRGKMFMRIRSPFEIFFDHTTVREFSEEGGLRWAIVVEMIDSEEAQRQYGLPLDENGNILSPEGDLVGSATPGAETSLSMLYRESLSVLSNISESQFGYYGASTRGAGAGQASERILLERLYELPSDRYPEGLYTVRLGGANGFVVEAGPLPYRDSHDKPFIPIVHVPFKIQSGRVWGKTIGADLLPLQDARNQTEAMMMLSERRMANPVWILPKGVVDRKPTGEPGEAIWAQVLGMNTTGRPILPTRLEGIAPTNYFQARLEELDAKMEQLAGSFGVAHGSPPPGVRAASALALLAERQGRAVSPQMRAWENAWEKIAWQQMMIFREYAADQRTVVRRAGENSQWQVEKWSKADLTGAINVSVEVGSATPKSAAQRRAQIEALIRAGVINLADPEVNRKVLQRFGESDLISHISIDVEDAQKENERFMRFSKGDRSGALPRFRAMVDNHQAHLSEHTRIAKTDEFRNLEDRALAGDDEAAFLVDYFYSHLQEHQQALMAAMAAEQGPPEGAGEEGPGRPEDSGSILSRGERTPAEEESRTVLEPRSNGLPD